MMQSLPGFRDFPPEECARRNYVLAVWRDVARRYGFVEYDGPLLEPIELYKKKSGGELVGQLFDFVDKGERHVAMRPEMTPTLARMVAAKAKDYRKPIKWFCCPQFFRYEKQQRGRLREFYQFNADIIGEASPAADAELIALAIDLLREFGLTENDFVVRLCDRSLWRNFLSARGVDDGKTDDFLQVVDKIEREDPAALEGKLRAFGVSAPEVKEFLAKPEVGDSPVGEILASLEKRGLGDYAVLDAAIVRGLAYYTGTVFEVFDRSKKERALAGGGRYDGLLHLMSDGKADLPALGFGMGDVVLANLIEGIAAAKAKRDAWISRHHAADIYIVIAEETRRADALRLAQELRDSGLRVDFSLTEDKVGRQFQAAERQGAEFAVVVGAEWPQVKLKTLATRAEETLDHTELAPRLEKREKNG